MEIIPQDIEGLFVVKPKIFTDPRGCFLESYNKKKFEEFIGSFHFVQDNQSISAKHVLRGLHYQKSPLAQGKLVRVVKGAALDVAVDLRKDSRTYGQHVKLELSEENQLQFWIPEGFAHGFLSLKDNTILQYKCTNYYSANHDAAIRWNDSTLNIKWGIENPKLSEKDKIASFFKDL
jgi:dTDP-4-dehydrorhamnose 3,5-epimerase